MHPYHEEANGEIAPKVRDAVMDVVQLNFTMVERKLNEHATAINTISSDQRRLKRNFEDLEARFGRIERGGGGLQSSKCAQYCRWSIKDTRTI